MVSLMFVKIPKKFGGLAIDRALDFLKLVTDLLVVGMGVLS